MADATRSCGPRLVRTSGVPSTHVRSIIETRAEAPPSEITNALLRRWLGLLDQPHRLGGESLIRLLEIHQRLPQIGSTVETGRAAAQLLRDKIQALDPGPNAGRSERLPYLVLEACFLRGRKLFQAAWDLHLSERQMSRERAVALQLLRSELETPPKPQPESAPASR